MNGVEDPLRIVLSVFATGAVTGALAVAIVAGYSILSPHIRRYVSALRMRRVRRTLRGPRGGRRSS